MSIPRESDLTVNKYLSRKDVDIKRDIKKSVNLSERVPAGFHSSELTLEDHIAHLFLNRLSMDGRLRLANKARHMDGKYIVGEALEDDGYKEYKLLTSNLGWSNYRITITSNDHVAYFPMDVIDDYTSDVSETTSTINIGEYYTSSTSINRSTISYQISAAQPLNKDNVKITSSLDLANRDMCKSVEKVTDHLFEREYKRGENYGRYFYNGEYLPYPWVNKEIKLGKKLKAMYTPWNPELNITDDVCVAYRYGKRYQAYVDYRVFYYPGEDNYERIPWDTHMREFDYHNLVLYKHREKSSRRKELLEGNLNHRSYGIRSNTMKDDRMKEFIENFSKVPWYPDMLQIFDIRNKIQSPDDGSDATLINSINQDIMELNSLISF